MLQIDFQSVSKSFGTQQLFHNFQARITAGQITAVLGPNGSGKSTLLRLAARLLAPEQGKVQITEEHTLLDAEAYAFRRAMMTPELSFYAQLTAQENLQFIAKLRNKTLQPETCAALLEQVGLHNTATMVQGFSTGMRQRLKLAVLLSVDADVWLLDEPGMNLDKNGISLLREAMQKAARQNKLILLATNDHQEEAMADACIRLAGN